MGTLCIDTATDHGAVAISQDGVVLGSRTWHSKARHGENLFGQIEAVLSSCGMTRDEIDTIGVCIGPGKFTSVRVGLSTAKGLALGLDVPIIGVSSLRVLARSVPASDGAARVALMNAYRGDVFAAAYLLSQTGDEELVPPTHGPATEVLERLADSLTGYDVVLCGDAAVSHRDRVEAILGVKASHNDIVGPAPAALSAEVAQELRCNGPSDLGTLEPQYLRPSDATLPAQAQRASDPT